MKYFIVNTIIHDGEFEYFSQSPRRGKSIETVQKRSEKEADDWTKGTYRDYEVYVAKEISKDDFDVVARNIY